jgi:hypothetical protein
LGIHDVSVCSTFYESELVVFYENCFDDNISTEILDDGNFNGYIEL